MPDILVQSAATVAPALSATSDTPVIEAPAVVEAEPVVAPVAEEPAEEVSEPAEETEGEVVEVEEEAAPAAPEPKQGPPKFVLRRAELAARAKSAEERAERAEALLQEAMERLPKPEAVKPPEPPPPPVFQPPAPRPRMENFTDPNAYEAAVDAWFTETADRRAQIQIAERDQHEKAQREITERETQQRTQQEQIANTDRTYRERVTAAAEKYPDYADVVENDVTLPFDEVMAAAIKTTENGPDIAYHLATNRAELTRIAALPPVAKLVELGKLGATLATPPPPRAKPPAAPAPISPLRRGNNAAAPRTLEELGNEGTTEEYAAVRLEQLRSANRRQGITRVN